MVTMTGPSAGDRRARTSDPQPPLTSVDRYDAQALKRSLAAPWPRRPTSKGKLLTQKLADTLAIHAATRSWISPHQREHRHAVAI